MRVCSVCQQPVPSGMPVCPRDGGAVRDDSADTLSGAMVGEYRLKGIIGEGGMGQVYEGVQPVIGKRVAIKLLRRELASDTDEAARLLSEARTVNAIGHRGIIDIFSFGALPDGRQYFVMEYLSGVPLSRHIRTHGRLPLEDTLTLLDEMLAALGAAHGAGVIHRDLKPSNIFLVTQPDGSHFVKLLDFGIAKQASYARAETPQTRVSRVMGTPEYMAPEQARGEAVGPRTDLYALGVVAFQMLTGELLFDAPNPYELVNQHLSKEPRAPSSLRAEVPRELDALVLSLLEKDPSERPPSAEAVREQVKRLRRELNLHATQLLALPGSISQPTLEPAMEVETRLASPRAVERKGDPDDEVETRALVLEPTRRSPVAAIAAVLVVVAVGAAGWALTRPPAVVVQPVVDVPRVAPEPVPPPQVEVEVPTVPPPTPPVVVVQPVAKAPKSDPVATRFRRVQSAWSKSRGARSAEDQRLFDAMMGQVEQQLRRGAKTEAMAALDDFVASALGGREP
ncbi:MAG: serine/threonine-protein kinase [Myxococcaceae bacterium]